MDSKTFRALGFVATMFFTLGFALGINSYLIPVLTNSLGTSSGWSYMILAATFSTFIIFGYPASMTIRRIGYRRTMSLSFLFFAVGFCIYIISARTGSFVLFLLASFVSGTGNTFLQASVNPYTTILGPIESAARRICIMGMCNKVGWAVSPFILAFLTGKGTDVSDTSELTVPFIAIALVIAAFGVLTFLVPLPEVTATGEKEAEQHDCPYAAHKRSILQFPHLILGAVALFLYVGAETICLSTLVDYATELQLPHAANYAWIASIGMVAGYICGVVFIPRYLSQSKALAICSVLGMAGVLLVAFTPPHISIWFTGIMALGCSLIWPAIWLLAITDLGRFTKTGSSLLVMAIAGGAVIPPLYGFLKEATNPQTAYLIALPCFAFILYYGLAGYKMRSASE